MQRAWGRVCKFAKVFGGIAPVESEVRKMGQRGPKPGSGGRPRKPLSDKILDGNPGKRPLTVIEFNDSAVDLEGQVMPKPDSLTNVRGYRESTLQR